MTHFLRRAALMLASAGPAGHVPVAPGTAGSAVGVALWLLVRAAEAPGLEAVVIAVVLAAGVWSATVTERHYGREDPGVVVIDEVAGMLITCFLLPLGIMGIVAAFFAFRLFDIVKPYPAGVAERLPRGWGIMADDVVAGLYAYATIRLLIWLAPDVMLA